jgi:hypothetical protein
VINLAAQVKALQAEVNVLRTRNLQLVAQLQAVPPVCSPDDFASAVQRSLDKLQSQLASTTNPVSNFAVREFRLETNVQVDVTALGDLRYHFVPLDAKPDPATISRITLDIVPLPRQTAAGVFTPGNFKPQTGVSEIPGLTADQQALLRQNQIDTVADFVAASTRARSNVQLVALLKTDRVKLAGWVASAQLLTVQGIDGPRAAVLAEAGLGTIAALAEAGVERLVKQFKDALVKSAHKEALPIGPTEAEHMIHAARSYLGLKDREHITVEK